VPIFTGEADYRGAYGGRGSAKTRSFAKMSAIWAYRWAQAGERGIIVCGREFMNSLDESSLAEVKAAIEDEPWLAPHFDVGDRYIKTANGLVEYDFVGLNRNLNSIKSRARILLLWVDEAEPVTETAWSKAVNTVREEGAEVWVTWNPERKNSDTHKRFRLDPPQRSKIVEINWRDNPFFPATLDRKRLGDMEKRPDTYDHVWEGDFVSVVEGAYFASQLTAAKVKRIGNVSPDPLMEYRSFWDIGTRDATAIWVAQFVGREIRVLNYYEAVGQPLAAHLNWLRDNGYGSALCVLPHDGEKVDHLTADKFADHIQAAGFRTETVKNQGKGAAMKRVEAARRLFPSIWFNAETTEKGRDALGWYHEKLDDKRNVGLGPEHDWSSHGADAFGLMCVAYEAPMEAKKAKRVHATAGGWLG
jgi:phage terminase large subunit